MDKGQWLLMIAYMPLFMEYKQFYKLIVENEINPNTRLPRFHYELSINAPKHVKDSYIDYCKERNLEPVFY